LGNSIERTQSPCSRQRMRILVSARLQATAAPEAPEPMIRTSTFSLSAMSARPVVPPESRTLLDDFEQRPVALLHRVTLRERRTRLVAEGPQNAIVTVVGAEDGAPQRHGGPAADGVPCVDQCLSLAAIELREATRRLGFDRRQRLAHQREVATNGLGDISQ